MFEEIPFILGFIMVSIIISYLSMNYIEDIILIGEAHQIAERPITTNPDDDDFISREQLEKILNTLIKEFRSKGLSLIFADPHPNRLFNSVLTIPT